jgi:hypothetical protein
MENTETFYVSYSENIESDASSDKKIQNKSKKVITTKQKNKKVKDIVK